MSAQAVHSQGVLIEITRGIEAGIPIAIVPFEFAGAAADAQQPADIIESDLNLSGRFDTIARASHLSRPSDLQSVKYKDWRLIKSDYLVVGRVIDLGNSQYEVRFRLIDVFRENQLVGQKFIVPARQMRKVSHQISDIIYQKLTGKAGAFDTQIAYVTVQGDLPNQRYRLQVADSDGWNPRTIVDSAQPLLSPSWSADGEQIAYVILGRTRSRVVVQQLRTGSSRTLTEFPGINSAPAWSPDGRKLALTLSRDGNPEIYIYDLADQSLRRMTRHTAIDTEPSWSPDGDSIIFTSGRAGGPQIYEMPAAGGASRRLTFQGSYNAGASYAPDGKSIVLITNQGNGYQVGVYSVATRMIQPLTRTTQDESPSFAPNGDMIIYATKQGRRHIMATTSADGQIQQTLKFQEGAVREPAWSPFHRKP